MGFLDFFKKLPGKASAKTKSTSQPTTPMSIKTVLVAGASGNLGPAVVKELIAAKYDVHVLARSESSATFPSGVTVHKTDYSRGSLDSIFSAAKPDAVVSTINAAVPAIAETQIVLIDAAKAHGVKRFLPSEFGSDTTNKELTDVIPIFGLKIKAIEHLKSLEGDGFSWTALVTGPFFDWGIRVGFIAINVKEKKLYKWDDGTAPFTVTNLATIGKAIASLLSDSKKLDATANKYVYISSHTITLNEYIDAVQKATPGEKWTVEPVDSEEVLKKATEELKGGNHYAAYDLIKYGAFGKKKLGYIDESKLSNKLLGLEKEDFATSVKAALQ